ncbi:MAG TPA: cytochrome c biogenesis protein CcdA, partial [Actinomycetota bacterium]
MIADIVQTGLAAWWAPVLAFAAGLVSCLSPCVWPLLPGYVSFITGDRIVSGEAGRARSLTPMLLFIAGFTIVFVLLGAFASTFVQ